MDLRREEPLPPVAADASAALVNSPGWPAYPRTGPETETAGGGIKTEWGKDNKMKERKSPDKSGEREQSQGISEHKPPYILTLH